ncbi:hypothetical protein ABKN59_000684 [Abortiporus biennis]
MPQRNAMRERAWGTRYDTLVSSPPRSQSSLSNPSSPTPKSPDPPTSMAQSPTPTQVPEDTANSSQNTSFNAIKLPHDASIFVGSLPSNIEHLELTRLLTEHLADYAGIKNVKVVRDAKGGVCAFVQCESNVLAGNLLQTLQTETRRSFLGRFLRFEPARAFRALLISYRAPMQHSPQPIGDGSDGSEPAAVCLEPANCLRIFRPQTSKYLTVAYNDDARHFDPSVACDEVPNDRFSGQGLFMNQLRFSAEEIQTLATSFGEIESFGPFTFSTPDPSTVNLYPHDSPRHARMDTAVWEVKWKHREDCVSALMTLRRVPHLTVTWAHHMSNSITHSSPQFKSSASTRIAYFQGSGGNTMTSPSNPKSTLSSPLQCGHAREWSHNRGPTNSNSEQNALSPQLTGWSFAHSTPYLRAPPSPMAPHGSRICSEEMTSPQWNETDFPPLLNRGYYRSCTSLRELHWTKPVPGNSENGGESVTSPSPSSSLSVQPSTPIPDVTTTMSRLNVSGGNPGVSSLSRFQSEGHLGHHSAIPPTPDVTMSSSGASITPTTSSSLPVTPLCSVREMAPIESGESFDGQDIDKRLTATPRKYGKFTSVDREGGLDMFSGHEWDEGKLRSIFESYGSIENVQIVRPVGKKSAFAFIRFIDGTAGSRAVLGEHNQYHHGRQIRVQLRDHNAQRNSPWKGPRGRGRGGHFIPPRLHGDQLDFKENMNDEEGTITQSYTFDGKPRSRDRRAMQESYPPRSRSMTVQSQRTLSDASGPNCNAYPIVAAPEVKHSAPDLSRMHNPILRTNSVSTPNSLSPPPSSVGQPVPLSALPQQAPPQAVGYYPPQPWVHPYGHYPYAFPMMHSYVGFPPPAQVTPPEQDAQCGNNGSQQTWPQTAEVYKQFPAYPSYQNIAAHVPVYQPEALGEYMSKQPANVSPPVPQAPNATLPSLPSTQYHPMAVYPYMYHNPAMAYHGQGAAGTYGSQMNGGWMPAPSPVGYPHVQQHRQAQPTPPPHMVPSSSNMSISSSASMRYPPQGGMYAQQGQGHHQAGPPNNFQSTRRYTRRDYQHGNASYYGRNTRSSPATRFARVESR